MELMCKIVIVAGVGILWAMVVREGYKVIKQILNTDFPEDNTEY